MKNQGFLLVKKNKFFETKDLDFTKLDGFLFKPRNKMSYDGIIVNKLIMFNPSFTETILKKKIRNRLEIYLRFIIGLIDQDDDDTDISDLRAALNDLTRYKEIIRRKYLLYLDKRYAEMLMKKIELLEQELKAKIVYYKPKELDDEYRRSR